MGTYHKSITNNHFIMEKNEITPSLRLEAHQTTSDFDKADITHIETGRVGISALEDETLMSGESQERVSCRYFCSTHD